MDKSKMSMRSWAKSKVSVRSWAKVNNVRLENLLVELNVGGEKVHPLDSVLKAELKSGMGIGIACIRAKDKERLRRPVIGPGSWAYRVSHD